MGLLQVMDNTGHTEVAYSVDEEEALANAKAAFDEAVSRGMVGFAFETQELPAPAGKLPRLIKRGERFPEEAERVVMAFPLVGG